jgi:hypothetical protein
LGRACGSGPRFPDRPKHQIRVEPFPDPGEHALVIETVDDLAIIATILVQPKTVVNQGLMGMVAVGQSQRFGLNGNPKTEVVFR